MAALADTNVVVYRFDDRFPAKQAAADTLLREGVATDGVRLAHQTVLEFVAATTRPQRDGTTILDPAVARLEAEDLLRQFPVIYPDDRVVRTALQGMAAYGLSLWDAHIWATAEVHELGILYSEDFQHERWYGGVLVVDPFREGFRDSVRDRRERVHRGPHQSARRGPDAAQGG
ncbi:MAG: PIN domain-containing protein [Longimicrobiales bacterium]|nr:PIN domain-containing protein [Longimicrobiales bacterium]